MKKKLFFSSIIAASVMLASCSNEKLGTDLTGETSAMITITRGENALSKASGGKVAKDTPLTFNNGKLYFASAAGTILKVMDVVEGDGVTSQTTPTQIDIAMSGAQVITGVPADAGKVYLVGNVASIPNVPGGNINNEVKGKLIGITTQYDATGGVDNIALYGQDEALDITDPKVYKAKIDFKPLTSRIEIDQFSLKAGAKVTDYQIDGIFLNNYYSQIQLQGIKTVVGNLINNGTETDGQNPAKYDDDTTEYPSTDNNTYFDFDAALGIGTLDGSKVYKPNGAATWSYNVLAPTAGEIPHIVIRFSEFGGSDPVAGIRYITVVGFRDSSNPDNDTNIITKLEPGMVYSIADFKFDESDLQATPEASTVTVEVTVSMLDWDVTDVLPIH